MNTIETPDGRPLRIYTGSLHPTEVLRDLPTFAVMLPAFTTDEVSRTAPFVDALLRTGCKAFCCVGPLSEELHDEIDGAIVGHGQDDSLLGTETTWHTDLLDGCEWFVSLAGGRPPLLLAFLDGHPELTQMLMEVSRAPLD